MAIFISGMQCRICQKTVYSGEKLEMFRPFVANENSPIFFFNDGVFHQSCVRAHEFGEDAIKLHAAAVASGRPENLNCEVCKRQVFDPDDMIPFGYLGVTNDRVLSNLDFKYVHRHCLKNWAQLDNVRNALSVGLESGVLKGFGLKWLRDNLLLMTCETQT